MTTSCKYCFGPVIRQSVGRAPRFCSNACKQAHYRLSKNGFKRIRISARNRSIALRNVTGTGNGINAALPLRNAGTYSQVDWTQKLNSLDN